MPREPPHSNGCGPAAPATGQLQPSTRDSQLPEEKNNPIIFPHTTPFFVGRSETLSWNHPLPAGGSQPLPCCYPLCCLPLLWEPPTPKHTDSTGKKGCQSIHNVPNSRCRQWKCLFFTAFVSSPPVCIIACTSPELPGGPRPHPAQHSTGCIRKPAPWHLWGWGR